MPHSVVADGATSYGRCYRRRDCYLRTWRMSGSDADRSARIRGGQMLPPAIVPKSLWTQLTGYLPTHSIPSWPNECRAARTLMLSCFKTSSDSP